MTHNARPGSFKERFKTVLLNSLPPFDRFVAKGELEEWDAGVRSRQSAILDIRRHLDRTGHSILIPIIGDIGSGKTHFLWTIKNSFEIDEFASFINLPRSREKFFYYVYGDLIEDFGADRLLEFAQEFGEKFGAAERLYGFFKTQNVREITANAYNILKADFSFKEALHQCIHVLIQHILKRDTYQITERWLLGQVMEINELFMIGVNDDLSSQKLARSMLKLLIDHYYQGIVLLFDDFDKAIEEYQNLPVLHYEDEINWATDLDPVGEKESTVEEENDKDLVEIICAMLKEMHQLKLIITLGVDDAPLILERLRASVPEGTIVDPIFLDSVTLEDTLNLYLARLREFAMKNQIPHPVRDYDPDEDVLNVESMNPNDVIFYPLNLNVIKHVHRETHGNVRAIIRNFKRLFDAVVFEDIDPENLDERFKKFVRKY